MAVQSPAAQNPGGSDGRPTAAREGIKTQINLPWPKAIQIAMNALRIRFWRSMITASGIFLSVAFLCYSFTNLFLEHRPADPNQLADYIQDRDSQIWLVVMACLVCLVGIMNAMLMSVSERFREIGTMKCLGALDSLVVRLFMIEALFMGLVSSAFGWLLGLTVCALARWSTMGWHAGVLGMGFAVVWQVFAISVGAGALITCLAALLPAVRAAQLPPAAALRTDV